MRDARPREVLSTDVLVVGGGAAGLAAAIAAARRGRSVLLLERYGFSGGAAVAGLSGTICGLYTASERRNAGPEQVVHGFVDEFLAVMEAKGGLTDPVQYGRTFVRVHDPLVWREASDHLLSAEGRVRVLYHATVTGVIAEGDHVAGVEVFTKQGPIEVRAKLTVDASGDADVAAMAGRALTKGKDGAIQNPTMIFRVLGVDMPRFLAAHGPDSILGERVSHLISDLNASGAYTLPRAKIFLFPTPRPGELLCNATRIVGRDGRELDATRAADLSEAEIEGRLQVREYARFIRDHIEGCEASFVNDTGVQVGIRQSWQIVGRERLANDDVTSARKRPDGICRSPWPIELHSGEKPKLHWILDDYYEVPLGCFLPATGTGLLMAGRCLSAEHEAMASARVTAQCFGYGQAVGLVADHLCDDPTAAAPSGADIRAALNALGAQLT
ncbi:FAD-dependent oxidoreductase [Xanthobacter dioxanivorans]|uniref:FAD-dependent oxidoreductase n=1 Tax=Xanthobacter dioxanivorans TaxID=2528964 RepID=A0A974PSB1_9HYPH|nr:FAD-dependent oxidoreductase [Xanthobacter dioxanivorans]QRG08863.1 FAD-dependent oxidoreductase [Xanthobacter dioxanivorans]